MYFLLQRWALGFSLASLFQIPLDLACYPEPLGYHAIPWVAAAIVIWASFTGRALVARLLPVLPHEWPAILATTAYLLAAHADAGVSAAISGASNRSITGLHLLRVISVVLVVPFVSQWLRPTWHLNVTGYFNLLALVPVVVLQPVLLGIPGTWEARNAKIFGLEFVVEALVLIAAWVLSRVASCYSVQWQKSSERILADLDVQATLAQNLLETAVPPCIARSLLAGTHPDALARSFDSATIAFILLEDYSEKMSIDPCDTMSWLDHVFVAFDSVVDRYNERVNKIEVVANTYLLSTGLPLDDLDHVEVMCAFCADIQALCHDIPGVGPVKVRIGVASGPVTSGVIGHSRRFFRVFGDTVNMASRMMSTSVEGHIQLSEATANKMLSSQRTDASTWPFSIIHRGKVSVKGKGDVDTYLLYPGSMIESARSTKRSELDSSPPPDQVSLAHTVSAAPVILSDSRTADPADAVSKLVRGQACKDVDIDFRTAQAQPTSGMSMSLTIRLPRTAHSTDDNTTNTVDMVYKVCTPGIGTPSSIVGTPVTTGNSPVVVKTPGAPVSRFEVGAARPSLHRTEYKRTSSDIFLRRTVGALFADEIRDNPIYSRDLADVQQSAPPPHALYSKPLLHTVQSDYIVSPHVGGVAVQAPSAGLNTPIESMSVFCERSTPAVNAPDTSGSIGAIQRNALDVVFDSGATAGGIYPMTQSPGGLAMTLSAPFISERSFEVPRRLAIVVTHISAGHANDPAAHSVDIPFTRSRAPLPLISERDARLVSEDLIHDEIASASTTTPAVSTIDHHDERRSQRSRRERRLSTKSLQKGCTSHHTDDSRSLTTSPFKPLSIHDRVTGNGGSDAHPQSRLRSVEPARKSAIDKFVVINAQHLGKAIAPHRRLSLSTYGLRPFSNSQNNIDVGMQLFESTGTSSKPHVHVAAPQLTSVADMAVTQAPSNPRDPVSVSFNNGHVKQALPSQPEVAEAAASIVGIESRPSSNPFVIAWSMCSPLILLSRVVSWNALTVPRFVDQILEGNAEAVVQQKMVETSISLFVVAAITVTSIAIALTLLGEFSNSGQFFSLAVVVAVLSFIAWQLHRVKCTYSTLVQRPKKSTLLLTIFFSAAYVSLAAILIWHRECDVSCVIPERISPVNELTWGAFILSVADFSTLVARIDAAHSRHRFLVIVCTDVLWISLQSRVKHFVDPAVAVTLFLTLLIVHAVSLVISIHVERLERSVLALKCALEAAVTDRKKLLDDLFPPVIVEALVAGTDVPPLISTGAVVLHIDFVGFTRMCSELTPQQIMRTMNAIYSVFDELVEEASKLDGALWKVDTVGDAYMVVGGIARIGSPQREFRQPGSRTYDTKRLKMEERRTRELLERIFSLARAMQNALIDLREELAVPFRARMGVHCGDVVSGILGSQRPRFCVLGPAMLEAERIEASGIADEIACSPAVQNIYLSTAYQFESVAAAGSAPSSLLLLRCPQ